MPDRMTSYGKRYYKIEGKRTKIFLSLNRVEISSTGDLICYQNLRTFVDGELEVDESREEFVGLIVNRDEWDTVSCADMFTGSLVGVDHWVVKETRGTSKRSNDKKGDKTHEK